MTVEIAWTPSMTYKPGDTVLVDMAPPVRRLPWRLGWWMEGVGYCPTRGVLEHARRKHTKTVEAVVRR